MRINLRYDNGNEISTKKIINYLKELKQWLDEIEILIIAVFL